MEGKQLSHFRILSRIAQGGMGVIYKAEDLKLGRAVALKVLPPALVRDEKRRLRFITEARTAAAVNHPNIATIYEIDEANGITFIAMELLTGETLRTRIAGSPLTLQEALSLSEQIAEGLAAAHEAKIVHRDLKPDNIMVTPDGHAKILDFGLARLLETEEDDGVSTRLQTGSLTEPNAVMGTPGYMSPEQARGQEIDFRSDIFSFGCTFYEMLTGRAPFQGQSSADTISNILTREPAPIASVNAEIPPAVQWVIDKCLAKDRGARHQDTRDLVVDLRHLARDPASHSGTQTSLHPTSTGSTPAASGASWDPYRTMPSDRHPPAADRPSGSALRSARLWIAVSVVLIFAVLLRLLVGRDVVAPDAQANSLAIFSFENLSDRSDPQRYGQIFQDVLITALSGLEPLKVFSGQRLFDIQKQLSGDTSAGAAPAFDKHSATAVARQAGAEHMLTGSLGRLGDKWILTCQMVNVSDGSVVFSKRIDGDDLYQIADLLTAELQDDLRISVSSEVAERAISVREKTTTSMDAYRDYFEGQELLNSNKYGEAADKFRSAIKADPEFGQAHYKLAIALSWPRDNPRAAKEILEEMLAKKRYTQPKERLMAEATLARLNDRFSEALPTCERLVKEYPDEKEAWYEYGESLYHSLTGRTDDALRAFEKTLELDPDFELAYQHIFDIEWSEQRYQEALQRAEHLIQQDPGDPLGYRFKAVTLALTVPESDLDGVVTDALPHLPTASDRRALYHQVATKIADRGFYGKREEYLRKALDADPDHPDMAIERALSQSLRFGARWDEFEDRVRGKLRNDPKNTAHIHDLYQVLVAKRRYADALAESEQLAREFPNEVEWPARAAAFALVMGREVEARAAKATAEALATSTDDRFQLYTMLAEAHTVIDELNAAADLLHSALAINPSHFPTVMALAQVEKGRGRFDAARRAYEEVVELAPTLPYGYLGFIELERARGDMKAMVAAFDKAIEHLPPGAWTETRDIMAAFVDGNTDEGLKRVDAYVAKPRPDYDKWRTINNFSEAILEAGHPDVAEQVLQRAFHLDMSGRESTAYKLQGLIQMQRGAYDKAAVALRRATEVRYPDGNSFELLALNALLRGDLDGAERILGAERERQPRAGIDKVAAMVACERGRFKQALPTAERCVAADSTRESHELLAWALIAGDLDIERGVREAAVALTLPPSRAVVYRLPCWPPAEHSLGLAALKRHDASKALEHLLRAVEGSPRRASLQADLAKARAAFGT